MYNKTDVNNGTVIE